MAFGDSNKGVFEKPTSNYVRSKPGEEMSPVVFLGDERIEHTLYSEARGRSIIVPEGTAGAQQRFAVNVYLVDENRVAIFEAPAGHGRAIFAERPGDWDVVKLSRTGAGKSTRYHAQIVGEIDEADRAAIEAMPLHPLDDVWATSESYTAAPVDNSDKIPF